jgi:hypothetical protein
MNRRMIRAFTFAAAASLSVLALQAQSGWTNVGCWSPYPNCVGAKDVYQDSTGAQWECRACGTTTNPGPSTCYKVGSLNSIGYWCS